MDWKKLAVSAVAAVVVFAVLWFFGALISPMVIYAAFSLAIGYVVYTKVAWWEINKARQAALDAANKIKG